MRLRREFFEKPASELAKALLGKHLVCGRLRGRIVETEAYLSAGDPASHSRCGLTLRNAPMFGPPGRVYVYLIYGMHHCFNIASGKEGDGEAVLIRAAEPVSGIPVMQKRRGTQELKNLCSGPGKLALAFGITKRHNNLDLSSSGFLQIHCLGETPEVRVSGRIGVSAGQDLQLRFFIEGNRFVSRHPAIPRAEGRGFPT